MTTPAKPRAFSTRHLAVGLAGYCAFVNLYAPQSILPMLSGEFGASASQVLLSSIARREYSVVAAAILPLAAVGLGAAGVLADRTGVQLALWLGVATLTGQAIRYAQLERLSRSATFVTVTLNLGIGLAIIALEVLIAH